MANKFVRQIARWLPQRRPSELSTHWNGYFPSHRLGFTANEINEPIEEELLPGNRLQHFAPIHPGQILGGRYKLISKLGFGAGSTVWLAENLRFLSGFDRLLASKEEREHLGPRFVSIKIATLDTGPNIEATYLRVITVANPSHDGLEFVRLPIDEFQYQGPGGKHSCLVYKPMRETLLQFQHRWPRQRLPLAVFKLHTFCLLEALDYLHTECNLIHTDIKRCNIMMPMNIDNGALVDFAKHQTEYCQPRHTRSEDGRATYLSNVDFGPLASTGYALLLKLTDFDRSVLGVKGDFFYRFPVQIDCYRAPEAVVGSHWSYGIDIWNFGLLMWNLLEDVNLFERCVGDDGTYDAHVHLAQMASLLGNPPEEFIKMERLSRTEKLELPYTNNCGRECTTTNEY